MPVPIGMGTVLAVSTSTGSLAVGGIRDIGGPEADCAAIDVTSMDSTGNYRVFLSGGPIDGGEVPLDVVFMTTNSGGRRMVECLKSGAEKNYTITFNTTAGTDHMHFAGIVSHIGQSIPYEGHVSRAITLKVTKTPGFTT